MATQLKQPASGTVVTTTLGAIQDGVFSPYIDDVRNFPKKDSTGTLTQNVVTYGRTGADYVMTFFLTTTGGTTPHAKWKAIFERWVANPKETVELSVDYGNSDTETVQGIMDRPTKTVQTGEGGVKWMVTIPIQVSSYSLS